MIDRKHWYEVAASKDDGVLATLANELDKEITRIENSPGERMRRNNMIYDLELYYGMRLGSLYDISLGKYDAQDWAPDDLTNNVLYACVGAVVNWVCSFNPRADFTPSNGDYKLYRGAKAMRQSCDAWMDQGQIYDERDFMFRDVLTSDAGVIKVFEENQAVTAARYPSWEFLVSEEDGRYRKPECIHHARWISLEQALSNYGDGTDETDALIRSGARSDVEGIAYSSQTSVVRVADSYKRGDGKKGGRHVIMVGRFIALNDEWKYDGHPIVVKRFDWRAVGFWGVSAINSVRGAQLAMNSHTGSMDEAHDMSSHQILLAQEQDAPMQHSNATVRVYKYKNNKPDVVNPPPVGAEAYKWAEFLRAIVYETWGVPPNLAQGMTQPGTNSGIAKRESVEIKSDRISRLTKMNERIITEVADWWRKLSNDLPASEWQVMDRGMLTTVKTPRLGDNVAVTVLPTSLFGASASGRVDKAFDLVDRKVLTEEEALRAVDVKDLDPIINLRMAEANLREQIVDDILQDGDMRLPPEYMDPARMYEYAKQRYFGVLTSKVKFPPGHVELLCSLIDAEAARAKASQGNQAAAAVTQPPPPPAPPPGMAPPPEMPMADPSAVGQMSQLPVPTPTAPGTGGPAIPLQ